MIIPIKNQLFRQLEDRSITDKNVNGVSKETEKIICIVIFAMMGISVFAFLFCVLWLDLCRPKKQCTRSRAKRVRWPNDPAAGIGQSVYGAAHRSRAYGIPDIPLRDLERCVHRND